MMDGVTRTGTKHDKHILDVDGQIEHLKSKGIKFEKCPEPEARAYLSRKCNLFKVVSYRKLFPKYCGGKNDGKYVDLDFAQLKTLSTLDQLLRETLLAMTLELEHFQKVSLLHKLEEHKGEDGYTIVSDFMASLDEESRRYKEKELRRSGFSPYSKELYDKYKEAIPAWAFLELTSFGTLLDFTLFCGARWSDHGLADVHYDFRRVKSIRNLAAHGSCLINSFSSSVTMPRSASQRVLAEVSKMGVSRATRKKRMRSPAMQEIATVLVLYAQIVPEGESRSRTVDSLKSFFARVAETRGLLPEEGPGSTAMSALRFIKRLTKSLGLLE